MNINNNDFIKILSLYDHNIFQNKINCFDLVNWSKVGFEPTFNSISKVGCAIIELYFTPLNYLLIISNI